MEDIRRKRRKIKGQIMRFLGIRASGVSRQVILDISQLLNLYQFGWSFIIWAIYPDNRKFHHHLHLRHV